MRREIVIQGVLLIVVLAILFPRVFFAGEYAVASSLMGQWAPWDAVFGEKMRPHQNPLTIETVMAFNADFTLVKQQLANGEWPLWNPLQFTGTPLLANYQSAIFYPPRLLHAAFPIPLATTLYVLLKLWLCGMLAYGYGRVIGLVAASSRFLSLAWMLGGYTFTWSYWTPTDVAAWLPLVLIGVEFVLRGSTRRGFAALLVGAVLMLLAGHPESAFVNGLGAGLYFLLRLAVMRAPVGRIVIGSACALAAWWVALLICAIQIIPFAEYAGVSNNVSFREGALSARHAIEVQNWVSMFVPRYFGTNVEENFRGVYNSTFNSTMYPGIAVWIGMLLLIGAWRHADRKRTVCWLATSTLFAVLAFNVPVLRPLFGLPILSSLWQCYFFEFALFGFAVLAAIGLDAWCRGGQPLRAIYPVVIAIAILAIILLPKAMFDLELVAPDGQAGYLKRQIGVAAVLAGLSLALLYAGVRTKRASAVTAMLTVLLVADLAVAGRGLLPTTPREQHYPDTPMTERLQALPEGSRVDVVSHTDIRPGLMTPYGVEEHWGYDGILPARIITFHAFLDGSDKAEILSGVTHALAKVDEDSDEFPSELQLLERTDALPRAYVAFDWEVEPDADVLIARLRDDVDGRRTVLIDRPVDLDPLGESAPPIATAEIVSHDSTRTVVRTETDRPGVLVLLDAYYPGWSAQVDGENSEIVAANHAFRAVAVDAGAHEIVFSYAPRSFAVGRALSAGTLVLALAVAILLLRRVRVAR